MPSRLLIIRCSLNIAARDPLSLSTTVLRKACRLAFSGRCTFWPMPRTCLTQGREADSFDSRLVLVHNYSSRPCQGCSSPPQTCHDPLTAQDALAAGGPEGNERALQALLQRRTLNRLSNERCQLCGACRDLTSVAKLSRNDNSVRVCLLP